MRLLSLLLCVSLFTACKRQVLEPISLENPYQPLALGMAWEYQVDSIVYNEYLNTIDTVRFLLREAIEEEDTDALNQKRYVLWRYRRADSSQAWHFISRWTVQQNGFNLERQEDNQRLIRLSLPLSLGHQWDGLVYLKKDTLLEIPGGSIDMYKDWDAFEYLEMDQAYQTYDSTLLVLQVDKTNQIERRFSQERYAKGIGLIWREQWILDTQCGGNLANCQGMSWETKAEKGFILRQKLLHFEQ